MQVHKAKTDTNKVYSLKFIVQSFNIKSKNKNKYNNDEQTSEDTWDDGYGCLPFSFIGIDILFRLE